VNPDVGALGAGAAPAQELRGPRPDGARPARRALFAAPEDFEVEELALYEPSGDGAHTFVLVEKRLRTTEEVARVLARAAGVRPGDVGYAGRKDRFAIARQWLSVPGLAPDAALALEAPGVRVLDARRHPHKLRTGQLRGNRFRLRLSGLAPEALAALPARAAALYERGLPNRFGAQRYGADGANAERAAARLAGDGSWPRDRREARFLLSALQAAVFDDVLARRPLPLHRLETGDVAMVCASGGAFLVEDAASEQPRADRFEISPTGPIFGTRTSEAQGAPGARERESLARFGIDLARFRLPRGLRARGARRPLRVRPEGLAVESVGPDAALISVALAPGTYATVLVEALLEGAGSSGDRESQAAVP
jgi:tRNA pseudouridine13 synthase